MQTTPMTWQDYQTTLYQNALYWQKNMRDMTECVLNYTVIYDVWNIICMYKFLIAGFQFWKKRSLDGLKGGNMTFLT